MIDLLYTIIALPVCTALICISVCMLNVLNPKRSKLAWICKYFAVAVLGAGVGFEALMQPALFDSALTLWGMRAAGLLACALVLRRVLKTSQCWIFSAREDTKPPKESQRAELYAE
jgi:hypothetical protein